MAAPLAVLGVLGLGGCVDVTGQQAEQRGAIGAVVHLQATVAPVGGTGAAPGGAASGELLAGFLVRSAAQPPAMATAAEAPAPAAGDGDGTSGSPASGRDGATALLVRDPSLDAALERDRPAPAGRRWAGFRSVPVAGSAVPAGAWSVSADFTVPDGDDRPLDFTHAAMAGARGVGAGLDTDRPVDCAEPATLCGPTSEEDRLVLRDLRGAGGAVRARAGASVVVPFRLRRLGGAAPAFALDAATTLPGATAAPVDATLAAGPAGFADAAVAVRVPDDAAPGTYPVELEARAGGDVRRFTGSLTVVPAGDGSDGPVTVVVRGQGGARPGRPVAFDPAREARLVRGRTLDLGPVWCLREQGACSGVDVTLSVPAAALGGEGPALVLAGRRLTVPAGRFRRVRLHVGPRVRRALRDGRRLDAVVTVRPKGRDGATRGRVTLRRG